VSGWSLPSTRRRRARVSSSSCTWALLSSRAIPALSRWRRVRAQLPGCRYPDVAARRAQGDADAQGPVASALAPRRSSARPGFPGRAAGPVSPPVPRAEVPRTRDSSSNPGDPIHYEFNLGKRQNSSTEVSRVHRADPGGSWPAIAGTCVVATRGWLSKHDDPAHIPRLGATHRRSRLRITSVDSPMVSGRAPVSAPVHRALLRAISCHVER
jgi:hypothetical protein